MKTGIIGGLGAGKTTLIVNGIIPTIEVENYRIFDFCREYPQWIDDSRKILYPPSSAAKELKLRVIQSLQNINKETVLIIDNTSLLFVPTRADAGFEWLKKELEGRKYILVFQSVKKMIDGGISDIFDALYFFPTKLTLDTDDEIRRYLDGQKQAGKKIFTCDKNSQEPWSAADDNVFRTGQKLSSSELMKLQGFPADYIPGKRYKEVPADVLDYFNTLLMIMPNTIFKNETYHILFYAAGNNNPLATITRFCVDYYTWFGIQDELFFPSENEGGQLNYEVNSDMQFLKCPTKLTKHYVRFIKEVQDAAKKSGSSIYVNGYDKIMESDGEKWVRTYKSDESLLTLWAKQGLVSDMKYISLYP